MTAYPDEVDKELTGLQAVRDEILGKSRLWWLAFFLFLGGAIWGASVSPLAMMASAVTAIVAIFQALRLQISSLDKNRQQCAQDVLQVVKRDMSDNAPVAVEVRFADIADKENTVKSGISSYFYSQQWLLIRGKFADNTKFLISVKELLVVKQRKGKRKPKGFVVTLILAYPTKKYPDAPLFLDQGYKSVQLPKGAELKTFRLTDGVFRLAAKLPPGSLESTGHVGRSIITNTITMLLLSAYQVLNFASTVSRPAR